MPDSLAGLTELAARVPYLAWLGVHFSLDADGGLVAHLPYAPHLIGNPLPPALHGGVTAAFLETTALAALSLSMRDAEGRMPGALARTIDITIDYLRPGRPEPCHARAILTRSGRRYASVRVEAWQSDPARPFAEAMGHFLMPREAGAGVGAGTGDSAGT